MKLRELMTAGITILNDYGIDTSATDARLLIMHILGINYTDIIMKYEDDIDEKHCEAFMGLINMRKNHKPCQYIIGNQDFMGYSFHVEEGVLIPRPETELLVEEAIRLTDGKAGIRALDMCCGSGCIGISLKLIRNSQNKKTEVVLADISDKAIEVASINNKRLDTNCELIQSDLFGDITGKYDLIMSNPPYIKSSEISELMAEVKEFEPIIALDGKEDGLFFYRRIIKNARDYLLNGGWLIFEIGYDQYEAVETLLINSGYEEIRLIRDYAGLDRVVVARYSDKLG